MTYVMAGRTDRARALADRALDGSVRGGLRGQQAWALRLLGEIASASDPPDPETAEAYYGDALALADELGMRPLAAHCHAGLANLHCRARRDQQPDKHFDIATTMYREMGMTYWLEKLAKGAST